MATTISGNVISTAYKNLIFTAERDADATHLYFTDNSGNDEEITAIDTNFTFNGTLTSTGAFAASAASTLTGAVSCGATLAVTGNSTLTGDLTVNGADITIGADADGTDRTVVFGHTTLKSIMGIDDSADRFVINTDATFDGTIADNDFSIDASGNAYILGDLTVTGADIVVGADADGTDRSITFGHTTLKSIMGIDDDQDVFAINTDAAFEAANDFEIDASGNVTIGNGELRTTGIAYTDGDNAITIADSGHITAEANVTIDGTLTFSTASDIIASASSATSLQVTDGSNPFVTFDKTNGKTIFNKQLNIASTATTIATQPTVTNLAGDGSVPITGTYANIDANGSARTGIRFGGAGTAGQILIVHNTGGEALTFHNTEGTALLRGIHADHDTMEANFMGFFISDGTYWNLIAGGVDSQPDVGLTAS